MNTRLPSPLDPPLRPPPIASNCPTRFRTIMTPLTPCLTTSRLRAVTFRRFFERRIVVMIVASWVTNIPSAPLTLPSADDGNSDATCALFHPLLSISVPVPTDDSLPAPSPKFLLDTGVSTTFVDPKLAARLGWDVRRGTVWMQVRLAGGMAGPLVTDTVVGSFSLGGCMYSINGVAMDLHGTYDDSLARLLKAGSADLVGLGMRESGVPVPPTTMNSVSATATLSNADTHTTHTIQLLTCAATESASLTDVLRHLQAEFHDVFCDDLGDV
ncbi:hypothetical protein C346_06915 [Cryptococcus neoformans D17-1]|nr:hypothetical protein C346_06915 [Cryptococcus neoformans var. grubii D17-1]